jgi:hypothetical protein
VERHHPPRPRRRDLDRGLRGLDLDERSVQTDLVTLGDEPRGDDGLLEPLAEIRQEEDPLGDQ